MNNLDRVMGHHLENDFLVLQLNNNAGLMYFLKTEINHETCI